MQADACLRSGEAGVGWHQPTGFVAGKLRDDLADVTQRDERCVRVRAINYHLQRRTFTVLQILLEPGMHDDGQDRDIVVDRMRHLGAATRGLDHIKSAGRHEMRNERAAGLALIEIEHHRGDVVHGECCGVAEHQHLNDHGHDQAKHGPPVPPDLQELFHQHGAQAFEHRLSPNVCGMHAPRGRQ